MNKKLTWVEIGLILICFSAAIVVIALAFGHFSRDIEKDKIGDAATWSGAIFAGLAFGGTIWIATKSERIREREKWDTAVVLAAGLLERIAELLAGLQQIDDFMQNRIVEIDVSTDPANYGRNDLHRWSEAVCVAIRECPDFEISELRDLIVLPNHAAAHLAAAMQRIRLIEIAMQKATTHSLKSTTSPRQFFYNQRRNVTACILSLEIAKKECRRVVEHINADIEFHHNAKNSSD